MNFAAVPRFFWHRLCSSRWAGTLSITAIQLKNKKLPDDLTEILKNRSVLENKRVKGDGTPSFFHPWKILNPKVMIPGPSRRLTYWAWWCSGNWKAQTFSIRGLFVFIINFGRCLMLLAPRNLISNLLKSCHVPRTTLIWSQDGNFCNPAPCLGCNTSTFLFVCILAVPPKYLFS